MPSQTLGAPPVSRRRQRMAAPVEGSLFIPQQLTSLPPGVVDTRPPGLRVIDIRDGVQLRDGVLDSRPHGLQVLVDTPPSPFEAPERWWDDPAALTTAEIAAVTEAIDFTGELAVLLDEAAAAAAPIGEVPVERRVTKPSPYLRRSELRRREASRSRRSPRGSGSLSVPQIGIASALGLATIAAPLSGSLSAPLQAGANRIGSAAVNALAAAPPAAVAAPFPKVGPGPVNGVEESRLVVDDSRLDSIPSALAAPGRVLVGRASRGGSDRAVLPGCDGLVSKAGLEAANGKLPASSLCTLWNRNEKLRADAAVAFAKMNVAYRQAFARDICIVDGYRTLSEQYAIKSLRPGYAATPGTSEHGKGLAVDLCGGSGVANTSTFTWLRANAGRYGWVNPDWAEPGGSGAYEPWHWEYADGEGSAAGQDDD
ncbi:MAG: D-alanyl-D-alanine carboxypeptidase family protein [Kineosporiaceae bacterium]|nr:D-alanyl-D-alanine carboxypeptidase family protein [Kineosporiaceae bacterium]